MSTAQENNLDLLEEDSRLDQIQSELEYVLERSRLGGTGELPEDYNGDLKTGLEYMREFYRGTDHEFDEDEILKALETGRDGKRVPETDKEENAVIYDRKIKTFVEGPDWNER